MSFMSLAYPVQAAMPAAHAFFSSVVSVARPLFGLGAVVAVLAIFKPLLVGMLRAALLVLRPRQTLQERITRRTMRDALMLNRMARDLDYSQPSLAAELRSLASRS